MLYRKMKKTGDDLSILGFGCMRLPQVKGTPGSGKIDEGRATRQVHYAIEQGVNYFDTAMPYHMGASEPFLGRALSGGYRAKVKLATKLPPWSVKERADMDQLLKVQLDNLMYLTRVGGAMTGEPAYASLCENCGQCEDACPQHLPIQNLLQNVTEQFEKWWLKPASWIIKRLFGVHRRITLFKARRAEKRNPSAG